MKQTVTKTMFIDSFKAAGRENQFSYNALSALFDHLEDIEIETGEELELDPVAICCEFEEHDSAHDFFVEYDYLENIRHIKTEAEALESLRELTLVITFDGGVIVQSW